MCEECSAEWFGWLDYTLPPAPIALISIGDKHRVSRVDEWKATINTQQRLIKESCIRNHGVV